MGLFDNTDEGFSNAGKILERGGAALQGRLAQHDETQANIGLKQLQGMRVINEELENIALSSLEDPEVIRPKLKALQKAAKQIGVPISDSLVEHYATNPLSLGMAYDKSLTAGMTPQQEQVAKRLQVMAMKPGPVGDKARDQLDGLRSAQLIKTITKSMKDIQSTDPTLTKDEAFEKAVDLQGAYVSGNPKHLIEASKAVKEMFPSIGLALKEKEARIKGENRSPSVGTDREALAQELGFKSFADAPAKTKSEINTEVKRREDERIDLTERNQGRLAGQFAQNMSLQERRLALQEEQSRRLLPSQQKILTGNRNALNMIDSYEKAHDEMMKETGGKLSQVIKGAIAKNQGINTLADVANISGGTPAERKFAGEYNSMIAGLKSLTEEVGVLTDSDAVRILKSFNPAVTNEQFKANIAARKKFHNRAFNTALEDYQSMGKDVSRFANRSSGAPSGPPKIIGPITIER